MEKDRANRLIDEMLGAQSRFAVAWRDDEPLTEQQRRDEVLRDEARSALLAMLVPDDDERERDAYEARLDQRMGWN